MTAAELRAITAQGPAVVMVAKADMLALLDELEALRRLRDLPHLHPRAASEAWADAAAGRGGQSALPPDLSPSNCGARAPTLALFGRTA